MNKVSKELKPSRTITHIQGNIMHIATSHFSFSVSLNFTSHNIEVNSITTFEWRKWTAIWNITHSMHVASQREREREQICVHRGSLEHRLTSSFFYHFCLLKQKATFLRKVSKWTCTHLCVFIRENNGCADVYREYMGLACVIYEVSYG